MSKISKEKDTKKSYAHGAIVRMKLDNFLTYDSLEFSPGPNLNVIIGPNGTGKSTIVCAICLGMTGKPSVLGRAQNISDFIKHGKPKGSIEIELNNHHGQNYVIKRKLMKDNKSEWYLNEKMVKAKEIEDLVAELNIQVDNLCQFLPQEKVAEFARMNNFQLLESTEKAIGGIEMYEQHEELKDRTKLSKELDRQIREVQESLEKEEAINSRLENQVSSFLEKRKFEESIIWLRRKKAVLSYKEKRAEHERLKVEKDQAARLLNDLIEKNGPMNNKKEDIDKRLAKQTRLLATKTTEIQEAAKKVREIETKLETLSEKLVESRKEFANRQNDFKNNKLKVKEVKASIEAVKIEYEEAKGNLEDIQIKESEIKEVDHQLRKELEKESLSVLEVEQEINKQRDRLSDLTNKIKEMHSVKNEKMGKLRQRANDMHQVMQWLESNRSTLRGKVYDPMFLVMNITNPEMAKFVEHCVPFRDLASMILFEDSDDMQRVNKLLRDERKLKFNAALVPKQPLSQFKPPKRIEELRAFGFKTYMREIIEAPEAILVYLCLYYQVHQIPIGDAKTQQNISQQLPEISKYFSKFYTSSHQYSVTRSKYSQNQVSTSTGVGESYWLRSSMDTRKLAEYEREETTVRGEIEELTRELSNTLAKKQSIEKKFQSIHKQLSELKEQRSQIEMLNKKIGAKEKTLQMLERQNINLAHEMRVWLSSLKHLSKEKARISKLFIDLIKGVLILSKDRVTVNLENMKLQKNKTELDDELRSFLARKQELENDLEKAQSALKEARDAATTYLSTASKINEVDLSKGIPEEHKARFLKLPDTVEKLDAEIYQCEAMAQCGQEVDEQVVDQFNKRKRLIESLRLDLEKKTDKLKSHQGKYEEIKNQWLDKVEEMISEINVKFQELFKQLKCAGEISLGRPDNPEDFAKYGITIRVSFRSEEKLQELTAWQQSGGEKSVSTMMYMIALQEMTKCPFRVVDEINQGMDPINERKVFDIIVQNSCSKHLAQYFLLTPKLLPDLAFDDRTNVICVFNGPHNLPHSSWNLRNFIKTRRECFDSVTVN